MTDDDTDDLLDRIRPPDAEAPPDDRDGDEILEDFSQRLRGHKGSMASFASPILRAMRSTKLGHQHGVDYRAAERPPGRRRYIDLEGIEDIEATTRHVDQLIRDLRNFRDRLEAEAERREGDS